MILNNEERAARAMAAIEGYTADDGDAYADESLEVKLSDLLCDLRHLSDQEGIKFHEVDRAGYQSYLSELWDGAS